MGDVVRPSGVVTFLFTDIESSTRRWQERPEQMRSALEEHDTILRSSIAANDGYVFATGGDGFAAFQRTGEATQAAGVMSAGHGGQMLVSETSRRDFVGQIDRGDFPEWMVP
jgi:class 3 adenylate cyclase